MLPEEAEAGYVRKDLNTNLNKAFEKRQKFHRFDFYKKKVFPVSRN
jgi:hypothetical protein